MADKQYLTTWVTPGMREERKRVVEKVKVGTRTVQKKKSMFSSEIIDVEENIFEDKVSYVGTGKYSEIQIDIAKFSDTIEKVCNDHWELGYELFKMMETTDGRFAYDSKVNIIGAAWAYGYGYGYSVTGGVVLTFRKRD